MDFNEVVMVDTVKTELSDESGGHEGKDAAIDVVTVPEVVICNSFNPDISIKKEEEEVFIVHKELKPPKKPNKMGAMKEEEIDEEIQVKEETYEELSVAQPDAVPGPSGSSGFDCSNCSSTFQKEADLALHMVQHAGEYRCQVCDHIVSLEDLQAHSLFHVETQSNESVSAPVANRSEPIKCLFCYKFFRPDNFEKHVCYKGMKKTHSCTLCDFTTSQKYVLEHHLLSHSTDKPLTCSICSFQTADASALVSHTLRHSTGKLFKCFYCDHTTTRRHNLRGHILSRHTVKKPFSCTLCEHQSKDASNLKEHYKTHSETRCANGGPFNCTFCDRSYLLLVTLKRHVKTVHTTGKVYSCSYCDYKASLSNYMKIHVMRKHTMVLPHQCGQCSKSYLTKTLLRDHVKCKHPTSDPLSCPECDFKCYRSNEMKVHNKMHAGESPYQCSLCDYKCSYLSYFERHVRKHTGERPFKCCQCDNAFADASTLKNHLRRIHGAT